MQGWHLLGSLPLRSAEGSSNDESRSMLVNIDLCLCLSSQFICFLHMPMFPIMYNHGVADFQLLSACDDG